MIATSGFLTALILECTKFVFGRGSAPDPAAGAYSAPPDSLAGLRGSTSKGDGEGKRERKGKEETGGTRPSFADSWMRPCEPQFGLLFFCVDFSTENAVNY